MVVQQASIQLLQLRRFLPEDFYDFALARGERPGGPLDQQLDPSRSAVSGVFSSLRGRAAGNKRFCCSSSNQPLTQPIEPAPRYSGPRAADPLSPSKLARASAPDRLVQLRDRSLR